MLLEEDLLTVAEYDGEVVMRRERINIVIPMKIGILCIPEKDPGFRRDDKKTPDDRETQRFF